MKTLFERLSLENQNGYHRKLPTFFKTKTNERQRQN